MMTAPCSVEPPGFVSKTIGFGAPCPDCGYMDCHARYLRWEAERGLVRAQVDRAPRPEWVIDTATHARLTLHGAVADVWQAIPDDPTAWIWAVQDGDCYVRLHESMASAQIAAEDAMADASKVTPCHCARTVDPNAVGFAEHDPPIGEHPTDAEIVERVALHAGDSFDTLRIRGHRVVKAEQSAAQERHHASEATP